MARTAERATRWVVMARGPVHAPFPPGGASIGRRYANLAAIA
jgi:hypothetical protein